MKGKRKELAHRFPKRMERELKSDDSQTLNLRGIKVDMTEVVKLEMEQGFDGLWVV